MTGMGWLVPFRPNSFMALWGPHSPGTQSGSGTIIYKWSYESDCLTRWFKIFSAVSVSYYYLVNGFADYLELADIDVVYRLLGKRFLGRRILCAPYNNKKYKEAGLLLSLFF
jgi:hypothetical protein